MPDKFLSKSEALFKYRSQLCERVGTLSRQMAELEDEIELVDREIAFLSANSSPEEIL